jgi:hypothetical protein
MPNLTNVPKGLVAQDQPGAPLKWNPRFVAYATSRHMTPTDVLDADQGRWPGGQMTGFTLYIGRAWAAWRKAKGISNDYILGDADHRAFDQWLPSFKDEASNV